MSELRLKLPSKDSIGFSIDKKHSVGLELRIEHEICDNDIDPKTAITILQNEQKSMIRYLTIDELKDMRDFIVHILKMEGVC
jgi:hypothetical protein